MKLRFSCIGLIAIVLASVSSSCVTQRTVTKGGKTVSSGYVVKKPFEKPGD